MVFIIEEVSGGNDLASLWRLIKLFKPWKGLKQQIGYDYVNSVPYDPDKKREDISIFGWMDAKYDHLTWNTFNDIHKDHDYGVGSSGELMGGQMLGIVGPSMEQIDGFTRMFALWKRHRYLQPLCNQMWGFFILDGLPSTLIGTEQLVGYARKGHYFQAACTPREALRFASAMRAPAKWTQKDKKAWCETVLEELGLLESANTCMENLTELEKKLTHIGLELIIKPRLLVVEEANVGLTADDSLSLVRRLAATKRLQEKKMNIIVSFDRPSSEVFHMMDKVMVMSTAGQLFYGHPDKLSQKLDECGHPCPSHKTQLDHAIHLATMRKEELTDLCVKMKGDKSWPTVDWDIKLYNEVMPYMFDILKTATRFQQVVTIICRAVRTMRRQRLALVMSFFFPAILNIFLLLIFSGVKHALNHDVHAVDLVFASFAGMLAAGQPMFWRTHYDREQFFDEYNHGCYEVRSFLMAKLVVELVQGLVQAAIASLASRYILGLTGFLPVPAYLLTIAILGLVFASTSLCFAERTRRQKLGGLLALVVFLPQLLFTGVFFHVSQIPDWLRWIQYVCPLKHAVNVLAYWEFVHVNKETKMANDVEANLDMPEDWWVSALILVLFVVLLQFLAGRIMWIHALRVSNAGRRAPSFKERIQAYLTGHGFPVSGTQMLPPCKRTWQSMDHAEAVIDV